jgi:hypothetical protein
VDGFMKKLTLALFALTAISIVVGTSSTQGATESNKGVSELRNNDPESMLVVLQIENALGTNETDKDLLLQGWNQYVEDLNYSSFILNQYVNKNYSSRQAMTSNSALLVLNSQTVSKFERVKPQKNEYIEFYNFTLNGMKCFNSYLWYMGKFYETDNPAYILEAREEFNASQDYYLDARKEVDFIF